MDLTELLTFVAFVTGSLVVGLTVFALHSRMLDEVNARLDEKDQFDHLNWYLAKRIRLQREYRRLFPHGSRIHQIHLVAGVGLALVVVVASIMKFPLLVLVFVGVGGAVMIIVSSRL